MQALNPKLFLLVAHAAGVVATSCAALFLYVAVYRPLEMQQARDSQLSSQLQRGLEGSLDVRRAHLQLGRRLEELNATVEATHRVVPAESAESMFLAFVTNAAEAAGIDLHHYHRSGQRFEPRHSEVEVALRGRGGHAAICRFLDRVDRFPHAAVVSRLEIASGADPDAYPFQVAYTLYHGRSDRSASSPRPTDLTTASAR